MTLSSGVDEECSVCLDSLVEPVITRCAHVFCEQCIMDVITSDNFAPNCPLCRAPVNKNELTKVPEKKKKKSTETEKPSEESGELKKSSKVCYVLLLHLSVSRRGVIGQFCGPDFTVRPAKFESCSFSARPINLRDIIGILLTSFSRSVL